MNAKPTRKYHVIKDFFIKYYWILSVAGIIIGITAIFFPTGFYYTYHSDVDFTQYRKIWIFGLTDYYNTGIGSQFIWFDITNDGYAIFESMMISVIATILVVVGLVGALFETISDVTFRKESKIGRINMKTASGLIIWAAIIGYTIAYQVWGWAREDSTLNVFRLHIPNFGIIGLIIAAGLIIAGSGLKVHQVIGLLLILGGACLYPFIITSLEFTIESLLTTGPFFGVYELHIIPSILMFVTGVILFIGGIALYKKKRYSFVMVIVSVGLFVYVGGLLNAFFVSYNHYDPADLPTLIDGFINHYIIPSVILGIIGIILIIGSLILIKWKKRHI